MSCIYLFRNMSCIPGENVKSKFFDTIQKYVMYTRGGHVYPGVFLDLFRNMSCIPGGVKKAHVTHFFAGF